MGASSLPRSVLRFGAFELDARAGELRKGGTRIRLPPQPLKVLTLLASRTGELVSREEVRRELWGEETFVDVEQGLGACISRIRIALSDNARNPRYIETLPRRGYRFLVPVEGLPPPKTHAGGPRFRQPQWQSAGGLFLRRSHRRDHYRGGLPERRKAWGHRTHLGLEVQG